MNPDSEYYDEYHNFILDGIEPSSKAKKAVFNIIRDLSDRRGLKQEFGQIDGGIQDEIIETWISHIDNAMA